LNGYFKDTISQRFKKLKLFQQECIKIGKNDKRFFTTNKRGSLKGHWKKKQWGGTPLPVLVH